VVRPKQMIRMFQALCEVRYIYENLVGKLEETKHLVTPLKIKQCVGLD